VPRLVVFATLAPYFAAVSLAIHSTFRRGSGLPNIRIAHGSSPAPILMFGSPDPRRKVEWIANETAAKYGASVAKTTSRGTEVYGEHPEVKRVRAPELFGG